MTGPILTIVIGVAAGVLLMWLVLLVGLALLRPDGSSLRDAARIVPDVVRLISRLGRDRTLGRAVRIRLALLGAYLAMPIDLVPDFLPLIGYADDAIAIGIVLRSVIRHAGPDVVRSHWPGTMSGLHTLARLCRIPDLYPH